MKFDVVAKFNVVVVGSGISGLICAIELAKQNKTVCILTKEAVTESSSLYAQGGIAVSLSEGDRFEDHLNDTLRAGAGLCNVKVAKEIINYSRVAFDKLISYGVKFDLDSENKIHQTREAAHSSSRVCHVGGDSSGRFITKVLIDRACRAHNISISQGSVVLSIVTNDDGGACGVLVEDVTRERYVILACDVVIASGGVGQIYKNTTNPQVCTGDGIVMAHSIGAHLQDLEMIQFHPTVLLKGGDPFLITEAIRGEGAKLKNIQRKYFTSAYHELRELAPRDILARAILNEMNKTNSDCVYLELSNFTLEYFKNRFPTIYNLCQERKIDLFGCGIPVAPAAHYFIGGIKTDLSGSCGVPSLWAIGEVACNGFHGANRLASNSLLECISVPHFLVRELLAKNRTSKNGVQNFIELKIDERDYKDNYLKNVLIELKDKNAQALGLTRTNERLSLHKLWLENLQETLSVKEIAANYQVQEIKNMTILSYLICLSAMHRDHCLGVHFREDLLESPKKFKHLVLSPEMQIYYESEVKQDSKEKLTVTVLK